MYHNCTDPGTDLGTDIGTDMACEVEALKELHTLQGMEQELDLELKKALEFQQALDERDDGMADDVPNHDNLDKEKLPQKQGKSAVSNSCRSHARKETQSHIIGKRERDCDNEAGKQVTSMQKEETNGNYSKRQKK